MHMFLDWQRTALYWLESGKPIQRMALDGSNVQAVWNETWTEDIPITLDIGSSSFLWSTKGLGNVFQYAIEYQHTTLCSLQLTVLLQNMNAHSKPPCLSKFKMAKVLSSHVASLYVCIVSRHRNAVDSRAS